VFRFIDHLYQRVGCVRIGISPGSRNDDDDFVIHLERLFDLVNDKYALFSRLDCRPPEFLDNESHRVYPVYTKLFLMRDCAICTVFQAAPFTKLSVTTHMWNALSLSKSLRILPTNTSFLSCAASGVGYVCVAGSSCKMIPLPLAIVSFISSTEIFAVFVST